ncbi:MAG TPA: hypothetical protein VK509_13485 [Polyangiales bacterium]|nr:hypothetical protein [Polyangiales bacterium]
MSEETDRALIAHMSEATKLASQVATQARSQWADYRASVSKLAEQVDAAAKAVGKPSEDEKELMNASALVAASLADVLIDFADAAFDAANKRGEGSRRKAAELVRKVVKVAVDDVLVEGKRTTPQATRMLELRPDRAWETIYLARGPGASGEIKLALTGLEIDAAIEVRTNRNESVTLTTEQREGTLPLHGSRPSLSIRMVPDQLIARASSALLRIAGAHELIISLLLLPAEKA